MPSIQLGLKTLAVAGTILGAAACSTPGPTEVTMSFGPSRCANPTLDVHGDLWTADTAVPWDWVQAGAIDGIFTVHPDSDTTASFVGPDDIEIMYTQSPGEFQSLACAIADPGPTNTTSSSLP